MSAEPVSSVRGAITVAPQVPWLNILTKGGHVPTALAAEIEHLIVTGAVPDGTKLPTEREFADMLGISRPSVREAMHELSIKGLIDRRRSRGSVVVHRDADTHRLLQASMSPDEREFWEVIEFRSEIEPVITRRAAGTATPSDVLTLTEILDEQTKAKTAESAIALDRAFHIQIAALTHNQLFVRLAEVSAEWLSGTRVRSQATANGRGRSVTEHRRILEAIANNEPELAHDAMKAHISSVAEIAQPTSDTQPLIGDQ